MSSIHHRGTVKNPGLVLALDPQSDAACNGLAFRVPDDHAEATVGYLRERELISSAYVERLLDITLSDGAQVTALVYVVDTALEEQARIISTAIGGRGPNTEYLWNTVDHLEELGIGDDDLSWLAVRVRELTGQSA